MSGVPGKSFRWSRNRYPIECNNLRTISSGLVSFPLTARITALLAGSVVLEVFIGGSASEGPNSTGLGQWHHS